MSHDASAVRLGAADSLVAPTGERHEEGPMQQDITDHGLEARRRPSPALHPTSSYLESLPVPSALPRSSDPHGRSDLNPDDSHDAAEMEGNVAEHRVTLSTIPAAVAGPAGPATIPGEQIAEATGHNPVAVPSAVVRPSPRDAPSPPLDITLLPTTTAATTIISELASPHSPHHTPPDPFPPQTDGVVDAAEKSPEKMIFGNQATVNAAHRRRSYATTNAVTDYEADLTSKDRAKQKEAVKKFLAENVKQDWKWEWPRRMDDPDSDKESSPQVERFEADHGHWKERDEWVSNASENEEGAPLPTTTSSGDTPSVSSKTSPFRFESPDGVGDTIKRTAYERKRRRKKRLAEEAVWNEGLRCFVARRDAWTGARHVKRIPEVRFSSISAPNRESMSSEDGGSSTAIEREEEEEWELDTEIPIAPPILPPENAMRASILPAAYNTIYDKVVVQALSPSCPMNLKDVTRSCVQGWKRDGEWPPRATIADPPKKKTRKLSVASLFGLEKHEREEKVEKEKSEKSPTSERGALRRSLQRILSLGHGKDGARDAPAQVIGDA